MRTSDYSLNATEMFAAAGLDSSKRQAYMNRFKRHGVLTQYQRKSWVPFNDGVFLCQVLGLESDLQQLFSCAPLVGPPKEENYLLQKERRQLHPPEGYQTLKWGQIDIAYVPSARTVNATHLLKLGNVQKAKLKEFFGQYPDIQKSILRGNPLVQGTYVNFNDATLFCEHFDLDLSPVHQLLELPHGEAEICNNPCDGIIDDEGLYDGHTDSGAPHVNLLDCNAECVQCTGDGGHGSRYTERSYKDGSYLAPANRSFEQLLTGAWGAAEEGW